MPDVQIILQPDVNRDFVNWVEQAFKGKGLRSEVMYLHPRIPKDVVVQRQAAEGVHAVVDLDLRAQNLGRIPVQAFDRSAGSSNVRFDQYIDLEPSTAAEVIIRAKASGGQPSYGQSFGGNSGYSNPYGGQPPHQPPASGFPAGPPQGQYGQQPSAGGPDIASLVGQLNPAALQQLLSQIQPGAQNPVHQPAGVNSAPAAPQVDIQAILGSLGGNAAVQQPPPNSYGAPYGAQPPSNGVSPNGDAAVQVQNIMAQLARYRQ